MCAAMPGMERQSPKAVRPGQDIRMSGNRMSGKPASGTALATRTKVARKRPDLYRVLLLNDDYTPMEFVIHVLMQFFNKNEEEATEIMLHVHHHGVGECGTFTFEIAETKVTQVMDFARENQHPLQCVMEKK
ncbi:MAG: ATP-dependent Clp protease adaptor protein [Beijerinckiaceae bacterium]|nr:MAG: ATP-dependent Clp protease adaptor protein [Beijerinckiaceae bacterium]